LVQLLRTVIIGTVSITKTGIINDLHLVPPYSHPCVELVLEAFEDIKVDRIIINGDLIDFININLHGPKHPDIINTLEDEIYFARDWFKNLRERFPDVELIFLYGNHEDRLDRWLLKHAKPFWHICRLEKMLNLEALDIEFYEYNYEYQLENTNLYIQHSPPSYGVNGARTSLLKKMDANYIFGCSHREQHTAVTSGTGKVYRCWFNGWLGSDTATREHEKIFSYHKGHGSWQRCAGVAYVLNGSEFIYDQFAVNEIEKDERYRLLLEGNIYES
jgi:hypothetical protein